MCYPLYNYASTVRYCIQIDLGSQQHRDRVASILGDTVPGPGNDI